MVTLLADRAKSLPSVTVTVRDTEWVTVTVPLLAVPVSVITDRPSAAPTLTDTVMFVVEPAFTGLTSNVGVMPAGTFAVLNVTDAASGVTACTGRCTIALAPCRTLTDAPLTEKSLPSVMVSGTVTEWIRLVAPLVAVPVTTIE